MKNYREKLIPILTEKVEEGYTKLNTIAVTDKMYAESVMNIINTVKTIEELQRELNVKDSDMSEADAAKAAREHVEEVLSSENVEIKEGE